MVEVIITSLIRTVLTSEEEPVTSGRQAQPPVVECMKHKERTKLNKECVNETSIPVEPVERTSISYKHHVEQPSH